MKRKKRSGIAPALKERLLEALEKDRIYRQEGLTIGELARTLSVQEYRLRRLINGEMGFRNFNDLSNRYRIQEACELLDRPDLPIIRIATDIGYPSPGPFNRAFRTLRRRLRRNLHDAYFYRAHRLMHHPKIFARVHLVHHKSTDPSPWAALAFHPFEAVLEAGIPPVAVMLLPLYVYTLLAFPGFMMFLRVLGHLGFELYPKGLTENPLTGWNNTATHHNITVTSTIITGYTSTGGIVSRAPIIRSTMKRSNASHRLR